MKRFTLIVSILFSAITMLAENNNPFLNLFRRHFPNTYSDVATQNIKSFSGDSVFSIFRADMPYIIYSKRYLIPYGLKRKEARNPKKVKIFFFATIIRAFKMENLFTLLHPLLIKSLLDFFL